MIPIIFILILISTLVLMIPATINILREGNKADPLRREIEKDRSLSSDNTMDKNPSDDGSDKPDDKVA